MPRWILGFCAILVPACGSVNLRSDPGYPTDPTPWAPQILCVSPDFEPQEGMIEAVREALGEWGVHDWEVIGEYRPGCVPIRVAPPDEVETWPSGWIAVTKISRRTGVPQDLAIDGTWFLECPWARWATLVHEVGHAVGHAGHRLSGAMRPDIGCYQISAQVSHEDRADARDRRMGR